MAIGYVYCQFFIIINEYLVLFLSRIPDAANSDEADEDEQAIGTGVRLVRGGFDDIGVVEKTVAGKPEGGDGVDPGGQTPASIILREVEPHADESLLC